MFRLVIEGGDGDEILALVEVLEIFLAAVEDESVAGLNFAVGDVLFALMDIVGLL